MGAREQYRDNQPSVVGTLLMVAGGMVAAAVAPNVIGSLFNNGSPDNLEPSPQPVVTPPSPSAAPQPTDTSLQAELHRRACAQISQHPTWPHPNIKC
jgi:hypothetical protein